MLHCECARAVHIQLGTSRCVAIQRECHPLHTHAHTHLSRSAAVIIAPRAQSRSLPPSRIPSSFSQLRSVLSISLARSIARSIDRFSFSQLSSAQLCLPYISSSFSQLRSVLSVSRSLARSIVPPSHSSAQLSLSLLSLSLSRARSFLHLFSQLGSLPLRLSPSLSLSLSLCSAPRPDGRAPVSPRSIMACFSALLTRRPLPWPRQAAACRRSRRAPGGVEPSSTVPSTESLEGPRAARAEDWTTAPRVQVQQGQPRHLANRSSARRDADTRHTAGTIPRRLGTANSAKAPPAFAVPRSGA